MPYRTFVSPVAWGIGLGPASLDTVESAIDAIDRWLDLTPDVPPTRDQRDMMLMIRELLLDLPDAPSEAELHSVEMAMEGMAQHARTADASLARIAAFMSRIGRLA